MTLSRAQSAALEHVTGYARARREGALQRIDEVLRMSDVPRERLEHAISQVETHARVALHFHPDRPDRSGETVARALLRDGRYRSQFETGLSNGSVTAYPGGDRDRWEERTFGGAYQLPGTSAAERPKYGSLDLLRHPDGPSPRFGCCYLVLAADVSRRSTFTYGDSHAGPDERGTLDAFDDIAAALLTECFLRSWALGEEELRPPRLIEHLSTSLSAPYRDPSRQAPRRNLNHYIEAQVHGDVLLADDAEELVADPSFGDDETGAILRELCERYGIALYWHAGFELAVEDVPTDFRGPTMPSLARRVGRDDRIDAAAIGRAVQGLRADPEAWRDRGSFEEVLQELKLLWHVLVQYGAPHGAR